MSISVNSAMRTGLVSGKAAAKWKKPAILNQTRAQRGPMTNVTSGKRDEAPAHGNSGTNAKNEINKGANQRDRVSSMPSTKTGGAGFGAATRGSKSPNGGAVKAGYVPGRQAIDHFPQGQARKFPSGTGTDRSPSTKTGNTRMKAAIPARGGQYGGGGRGTQ